MAIRPKGKAFQVDVTWRGKRAPRVSAPTYEAAQALEARFKADLMAGKEPVAPVSHARPVAFLTPAKATLGGLIDIAYRARWRGTKSATTQLRTVSAWPAVLGENYPVANFEDPNVILDVVDGWAAKGNSPATINRKLAVLSVVLGYALERGLISRKPKMPRRREYEGRLRWYSDAEEKSWHAFALTHDGQELVDLLTLAADTGFRYGELMALRKRDRSASEGLVILTAWETKGNKSRSVYLTTRAAAAFDRLTHGAEDGDKVVPERFTQGFMSRTGAAWKRHAGLPADDGACFHTWRHTSCARLVQRGVPIVMVQKWMGHSTIVTTMRYAHLAPNSLEAAWRALEGDAGVAKR